MFGMILFGFDLYAVHRNYIFSNHAHCSVLKTSAQEMTDTYWSFSLTQLSGCNFEQGIE